MRTVVSFLAFALFSMAAHAQSAPPSEGIWRHDGNGARIELASLPHDVIRAFYGARGFAKATIETLVRTGCVFRSDMGNGRMDQNAPTVAINLADWRIRTTGAWIPLKRKEAWLKEFAAAGVSQAAQIAFRWATFPSQQAFQPGDFNWGMVAFSLPPATRFDVNVVWTEGEKRHFAVMKDLTCASS